MTEEKQCEIHTNGSVLLQQKKKIQSKREYFLSHNWVTVFATILEILSRLKGTHILNLMNDFLPLTHGNSTPPFN